MKIAFNRDELLEFAEKHFDANAKQNLAWNGRQVRNAFQTATALAEYGRLQKIKTRAEEDETTEEVIKAKYFKKIDLKVEHFKKVAKTARNFEDYMKTVKNNKNSADVARTKGLRNDDFDPNMPQSQKLRQLRRTQTSGPDSPSSIMGTSTPRLGRRSSLQTPVARKDRYNSEVENNEGPDSTISSTAEDDDVSQSD